MEGYGDCIDHVDRNRIIKKEHSDKTKTIQNKQENNKKIQFSGQFDVILYLSQMWQCSK